MQNQGRGRGNYKPRGRVMYPVEDLREKLNRMRLQRGDSDGDLQGIRQPPPDPHYNFLRDPLREDFSREGGYHVSRRGQGRGDGNWRGRGAPRFPQENRPVRGRGRFTSYTTDSIQKFTFEDRQRSFHRGSTRSRGGPNRGGRGAMYRSKSVEGRRRTQSESNSSQKEDLECLKSPINIKVDFSCETGLRKCTLDETVTLPEIKHVSDGDRRGSSRGRGGRGQGRGRGRGSFRGRKPQNFKRDTDKPNEDNNKNGGSKLPDEEEEWKVDDEPPTNDNAKESDNQNTAGKVEQ